METVVDPEHDTALLALLAAADPAEFDRRMETLLAGVEGLVRNTIQRTLRSHFHANVGAVGESIEDLQGEVIVRLVRKLRELQTDASPEPIQNFSAYAATVASNACYAYLRRRFPEWTRLKNQVRYVVTHDPDLALRRSETDASYCVLQPSAASSPSDNGAAIDAHALSLRDLVKTVVRRAGRPVELNELVNTTAELRGIRDRALTPVPLSDIESLGQRAPDPRAAGAPDEVWYVKQLWEEVRQLPLRQRMALLLNLRDDRGRGALPLFPLTATASIGQLAETLGMTAEDLAQLWNDLPMDDLRIAARLGISRQQVINLRKAARARLARRMAGT